MFTVVVHCLSVSSRDLPVLQAGPGRRTGTVTLIPLPVVLAELVAGAGTALGKRTAESKLARRTYPRDLRRAGHACRARGTRELAGRHGFAHERPGLRGHRR